MIELKLNHENLIWDEPLAACIGYFDGFHLGHQTLFNKTLTIAKQKSIKSAIISFDPDPWVVLHGVPNANHLTTIDDRKRLAKKLGFDVWISIEFDTKMANLHPTEFIDKIKAIHVEDLICGFDFKFGSKGIGTIETLLEAQDVDFNVVVINEYKVENEKVSSTRIKIALKNGDMNLVKQLLGRYYELFGVVVGGKQIGRKIGYPTANLRINSEYVLPKMGVYAGYVMIDGLRYQSMISIGLNPTVNDDRVVSIEAHIFDFDKDIYDKEVLFVYVEYLRPELKFNSLDGLIAQLKIDEMECRKILKDINI
jgi:riboflavin kinase / FMN adenylyltransferase